MQIGVSKIKPEDINNFKSNEQLKAYQRATSIIGEADGIIKQMMDMDDKIDIDFNKGKGNVMVENGNGFKDAHLVYNPDTKEVTSFQATVDGIEEISMKKSNGLLGLGDPKIVYKKENHDNMQAEVITVNKETNVIKYGIEDWTMGVEGAY